MARIKKITQKSIQAYLLVIIKQYEDNDERVKATDYLRAVQMLSTMYGYDKLQEIINKEELTFNLKV